MCAHRIFSAASAVEYTVNQHSLSHDKTLQSDDGWSEGTLATAVKGDAASLRETARGQVVFRGECRGVYSEPAQPLSHDKTLKR